MALLPFFNLEMENASVFAALVYVVPSLLGEGLEVPHGTGICRLHLYPVAGCKPVELLFQFQQRQRTLQAAGIQFNGDTHRNPAGTLR